MIPVITAHPVNGHTWSEVKASQSFLNFCDPMDYTVHGILQARILESVAFPFSRGSLQPQGLNPGLPHCRQILYQLSLQGSPRLLEWVVFPFSSGSSRPRNWTGVSCIVGRFFTNWAIREAPPSPLQRGPKWTSVSRGQQAVNLVSDGLGDSLPKLPLLQNRMRREVTTWVRIKWNYHQR